MKALLQFIAGFKEFQATHSMAAAEEAASRPLNINLPEFELCEVDVPPVEVPPFKYSMLARGAREVFQIDYM